MPAPTGSTNWSRSRSRASPIRSTLPPPIGGAAPPACPLTPIPCATITNSVRSIRTGLDDHQPIRKAIFPVAGLGTRLLPATKTIPKEMITIVDRPLIQYAVDEAREAGIETMIFVTARDK